MGLFSKKAKSNAPPSLKPSKKASDKEEKKGGATPFPWSQGQTPVPAMSVPAGGAMEDASIAGEGASSVPTLSGGQNEKLGSFPLRARGFSTPTTVVERIKRLKTKDLAFIVAGLAVLIMAPLAEYLMTGPENKARGMQGGFAERGPLFSESANPYEDGVSGISPGGLIGQDSDVITPLNVRDPSHLILGPGGSEKPAAPPSGSTAGPKQDTGWNDAISAAKSGANRAVQKTPGLPRPSPKMPGALRGLSALSGGSSGGGASFRLEPPPSSKNFFGAPRSSNALSRVQPIPGFRGGGFRSNAAGNGIPGSHLPAGSSGGGSTQETHTSGPSAGGSGSSGGRAGPGDETKNPGGNSTKDNRNASMGENLALLRAKMEMEKAIGLKWDKRHYFELDRRKMMDQIGFQTAAQTAQQVILALINGLLQQNQQPGAGGGGTGGGGTGGAAGPQTAGPGARARTPRAGTPAASVSPPQAETILGAEKAEPAKQKASEALEAIQKSAQDVDGAKKALAQSMAAAEKAFKDSGQEMSDAAAGSDPIREMRAAVSKVTELGDIESAAKDLKPPVDKAQETIEKFHQQANEESDRMERIFNILNGNPPPGEPNLEEPTVPDATDKKLALEKAEGLTMELSKGFETANDALQKVDNPELMDKVPSLAKESFAKYQEDLDKMVKGYKEMIAHHIPSYVVNMAAVAKHTENAHDELAKVIQTNTAEVVNPFKDSSTAPAKAKDLKAKANEARSLPKTQVIDRFIK